jgi:hypothetical protein
MNLTHGAADVLRALLVDLGHATDPDDGGDWPAYVAYEPTDPEEVITLKDTVGVLAGKLGPTGVVSEQHGVQIRLRARSHYRAHEKFKAIMDALDGLTATGVIVGDTVGTGDETYVVYAVTRRSGPVAIGRGKSPHTGLEVFTLNVITAIRQTT